MSAPVAPSPVQAELDLATAPLNQIGAPGPTSQTGLLVLVGAGNAHLHVLAQLAERPLEGVRVILVNPSPQQTHAAMLPGFVAGHYAWEECVIPLEPLLRHANVRWLARNVKSLDASQHLLTMDDGSTLVYDWLSVNTGAVQNRDQLELSMPGVRAHGLFVRPFDAFAKLWPRVVELGSKRALRIAIMSADTAGVELACAVRRSIPTAAITLVAEPLALDAPPLHAVRNRLRFALKKQGITVLQDRVTSIEATHVNLGSGASLACDVPLLATGVQPPTWLSGSGLALDAQGHIAIHASHQCTNDSCVFAVNDVSSHNGPSLLSNLQAATSGAAPKPYALAQTGLTLWFGGARYSVASWGKFSTQGFWVWWFKNWLDRRFVSKRTQGRT